MRKIFISVFIFSLGLAYVPLGFSEDISYAKRDLMRKSMSIEEEIDALIDEIHQISEETQAKKSTEIKGAETVAPHVITPLEITQTLIPKEKRGKKMNLTFQKANLEDALRTIGEAAAINIVLDPALRGKKVDFQLKNVPIEEMLTLFYNAYDLGSYRVGKSLYVSTKAKIKRETLITKIIKLQNVSVEEAKELIDDLVEVVNVSTERNTLIVVGNPDDIRKVENILTNLDTPQPQVILEAKVIEVDRSGLKEIGIDWSDSLDFDFQETKRKTTLCSQEAAVKGESVSPVYKITRSAFEFEATLKMLEEKKKAKILSSPRVTAINGKEAEIFVGDRVPYEVTVASGGTTTTEVRWVEPGIRLNITPSIIEKDFVVITIEPEVSYIFGWRGPDDQYPWVKTREATAHVRVKNGQPFIMGGLLTKEDKRDLFRIPILGKAPLIGNLFSYESTSQEDTELIISVTPTVISGEL